MLLRLAPLSLALCLALPAQSQTIVSPVQAANVEGSSNNVYPFGTNVARRYQQIHSDIGGTVKLITKLSFRMNAGSTATTYSGTTALDTELWMGQSVDWNKASFSYAANYLAPPSSVVARKVLTWGPQGANTPPGPEPFLNMDIPLDTPFVYLGSANSLAWEAVLYSYTATAGYAGTMDADGGTYTSGSSSTTSTGCIATGRSVAMTHVVQAYDYAGTLLVSWTIANGPSNAPTFIGLGATNPNLNVPGLCSPVCTDLLVTLPLGLTDSAGTMNREVTPWILTTNSIAGGVIYSQAHSIDPARPNPITVSNSNGVATTMPSPNSSKVVKVTRIWNDLGGVTATRGAVTTTTLDYGLVVQFTY